MRETFFYYGDKDDEKVCVKCENPTHGPHLKKLVSELRMQKRHWWSKEKEPLPWYSFDENLTLCLNCIHDFLLREIK
jgi:hypothetical protein